MKHWSRRGTLAWLLWPASLAFAALAATRRALYRLGILAVSHPGIPVVVVGNLSAGGSGKTPLVLWIAKFLLARGWRPGIVSRGYGGRAREPRAVGSASDPAEVGDEPVLLARRSGCPVWVGADRVAACRALRAAEPQCDLILSDDGLQHYALARDLEICLVDERGYGNGMRLPAGPLRESVSRLASVDAVVAHGAAAVRGHAMSLQGEELYRLGDASERRPLRSLAGQRVHAVAAVGAPERFFRQLASHGLELVPHPFPDHHPFRASDLEFGDGDPLVMTEKDAVKCARLVETVPAVQAPAQNWVLPVDAVLAPSFGVWLQEKLGGRKTA